MKQFISLAALLLGLSTAVAHADRFSCCDSSSSSSSSSDCSSDSECLLAGATPICQSNIPATLSTSGVYVLSENVTYGGSGSAITISGDNVKLILETASITLTNSNATGIYVNNVSEFVIYSDAITNSGGTNGYGIHIQASQKGLIDSVLAVNHFNGLFIQTSNDIRVQNSQFSDALDATAAVADSTNVIFDNCVFANTITNGLGLSFTGANQDAKVLNSSFPSASLNNLYVEQINGMIVDNNSFTNSGASSNSKANLVQFGGTSATTQTANDVVFTNNTIRNRPSLGGNFFPEGLAIFNGSGYLVQGNVIDIANAASSIADDLSGIHIGDGSGTYFATNVLVSNNVVQGPAINGIYPDVNSSGIVMENNLVSGAQKNGIFLAGTFDSTVQNNTVVNNGTNGIFVGENSIGNSVGYNVVNDNGFAAGVVAPDGAGIGIEAGSSSNTVQYNQIFNNALAGVNDQGPSGNSANQIWYNTAYANGTPALTAKNYIASANTIYTNTPGVAPVLPGANLSAVAV